MAKKVKIKLPKRVAGVKIPKAVRKGPIGRFMNSGAGQVIIAEAVMAAGAIYANARTNEDSAVGEVLRHPVDKARSLGNAVVDAGSDQTARLAYAFKEASRAFREALQEENAAAWQEVEETPAKKKSSVRASRTAH